MTRIEKSIIINKPVDEVFDYASDWAKWADWFEGPESEISIRIFLH